jgi:hypothetical protein
MQCPVWVCQRVIHIGIGGIDAKFIQRKFDIIAFVRPDATGWIMYRSRSAVA